MNVVNNKISYMRSLVHFTLGKIDETPGITYCTSKKSCQVFILYSLYRSRQDFCFSCLGFFQGWHKMRNPKKNKKFNMKEPT